MKSYTKEIEVTYFDRKEAIDIDEVSVGDNVYLEVNSPLSYGVRIWSFNGEITKITKDYFWILEYHNGFPNITKWSTEQIKIKKLNQKKYTKKWAKKSIVKLYRIDLVNKLEKIEYSTNVE